MMPLNSHPQNLPTNSQESTVNYLSGSINSNGFNLQYLIEGEGPAAIVIGSSLYYV